MVETTRRIKGRDVDLVAIETITRQVKVSKGHTSGHVNLPKKWKGQEVRVTLIMPRPFVCKGCHDIITMDENFSEDPKLCVSCLAQKKAVENNKCIVCGGENPKAEFWGQCEECFNKDDEDEELEELFKEIEDDFEKVNEVENKG